VSPEGRIAQLSLSGLELAAGLRGDQRTVARWLYEFGRLPRSLPIDRDFGYGDEPIAVLGLSRGGSSRRLLEQHYVASTDTGWYAFFAARYLHEGFAATCKLYLSPKPEALAEVFPIVAKTFLDGEVRSFKVARGPAGLLRPDKIVAYFSQPAHLEEMAQELARPLSGLPAQGVPFTAELASGGILSWGVDPDAGSQGVSWRSWVTQLLAKSLVANAADDNPVDSTIRDISAAGVDPSRWILKTYPAPSGCST
jgi:hypothetical protein